VPGNHDAYADAGAFDRALDGPLARFAATSRAGAMTVLDGAVVVAASTAIAQTYPRAIGALDEAALASIERAAELAEAGGRVAIAAMHHAPFAHASALKRWIDGLVDDAPIQRLLARHDRLAVLHGHTHRATSVGVRAGAAPRVFGARAVVDAGPAVRLYVARYGALAARATILDAPFFAAA
jgi:3',5'-cyclic AMP phosphodiesterase CpdA